MSKLDHSFMLNLVKLVKDNPPAKAATMIQMIFDGIYMDTPKTVDCKSGCNWCCYSRVDVTELEMKAVEAHIRHRFTKIQMEIVVSKSKAIKKKYRKMSKDERIMSRDACPLLFEGKCSVYESRPLLCRSALSTNSKSCEAAHSNPDIPVPFLSAPKNMLTEIIAAIRIGENKKEYELNLVDGILKHFK